MAKSPEENALGTEILRYDLGWRAINELLRSGRSLSGHERNNCFLNLGGAGSGRFADISSAVGGDLDDDGRVLALADWDFDGDPDMWIGNRSGPALRYLRNDLTEGKNFVAIRARGTTANRDAIGARIAVKMVGGLEQVQTVHAGQGYLAQSSRWLHFGLGEMDKIESVRVSWPGGESEEFSDVLVNSWHQLVEGDRKAVAWQPPKVAQLTPSVIEVPKVGDAARVLLLEPLPLPKLSGLVDGIGHARLISLWADWCAPCLRELKEWSGHAQEFAAAKLEIVALNVSETEDLTKWQALAVPFEYRFGSRELVEEFDVLQRALLARQRPLPLPSSFLVDAEGRLRAVYKGAVSAEQLLADVALISADRSATLAAAIPLVGRWHTPPGGSTPTRLAIKYIDGGYSSQAEAYINSLADRPEYRTAGMLNLLGALRLDRKEFAAAAEAFKQALKLDPNDRQANIELGGLLLGIKKGGEAEACFSTVLKTSPNDPELRLKLGIAQMLQEKFDVAGKTFREVIRLRPDSSALWYLGRVEHASGNADKAIQAYESAVQLSPYLVDGNQLANLVELSKAFAAAERYDDAIEILTGAAGESAEKQKLLEEFRQKAKVE